MARAKDTIDVPSHGTGKFPLAHLNVRATADGAEADSEQVHYLSLPACTLGECDIVCTDAFH